MNKTIFMYDSADEIMNEIYSIRKLRDTLDPKSPYCFLSKAKLCFKNFISGDTSGNSIILSCFYFSCIAYGTRLLSKQEAFGSNRGEGLAYLSEVILESNTYLLEDSAEKLYPMLLNALEKCYKEKDSDIFNRLNVCYKAIQSSRVVRNNIALRVKTLPSSASLNFQECLYIRPLYYNDSIVGYRAQIGSSAKALFVYIPVSLFNQIRAIKFPPRKYREVAVLISSAAGVMSKSEYHSYSSEFGVLRAKNMQEFIQIYNNYSQITNLIHNSYKIKC